MKSLHLYLVVMFIVGCNAALAYEAWEERIAFRKCVATFDPAWCTP